MFWRMEFIMKFSFVIHWKNTEVIISRIYLPRMAIISLTGNSPFTSLVFIVPSLSIRVVVVEGMGVGEDIVVLRLSVFFPSAMLIKRIDSIVWHIIASPQASSLAVWKYHTFGLNLWISLSYNYLLLCLCIQARYLFITYATLQHHKIYQFWNILIK